MLHAPPTTVGTSTTGDTVQHTSSAISPPFRARTWRGSRNHRPYMLRRVSLRQLLDCGEVIAPHEAIAIIQQLLQTQWNAAADRPMRRDDLVLFGDGRVEHPACEEPEESAVGQLLDAMLPHGTGHRVPGALRLAVARACRAVDAPPFGSLAALSSALERFERGDRHEVVRELVSRAPTDAPPIPTETAAAALTPASLTAGKVTPAAVIPQPPVPARRAASRPERRRPTIGVSAVRRDLRDMDARLFRLQTQVADLQPHVVVSEMPARHTRSRVPGILAAVLLSFVAGYASMTLLRTGLPAQPATEGASPRSTPAAVLPSEARTSAGDAATSAVETRDPSEPMTMGTSGPVQAIRGLPLPSSRQRSRRTAAPSTFIPAVVPTCGAR